MSLDLSNYEELTRKIVRRGDSCNMHTTVAVIIFRLIQIVAFPIELVGYILFGSLAMLFRHHSGVSMTALAPLYMRYVRHKLGTKLDEPGVRLMVALPNVSRLGIHLFTGPTVLASHLTGYVPAVYRYPYAGKPLVQYESSARTAFFDAALARHLGSIEQFVLPKKKRMLQESPCAARPTFCRHYQG